MDYILTLDDFEGPLDLLLQLVKKEEVDIFSVSLEKIIDEYLEYINHFKQLDLYVASNYLVMASDLMLIKSKKLLPVYEEETEEEELTEEELRLKIINYEKYKNMTSVLKDLEEKRKKVFVKDPDLRSLHIDTKITNNSEVSVMDLKEMLEKYLKEVEKEPLIKIKTKDLVSVSSRINYIRDKIKVINERVVFKDLFEQFNKKYIIPTFLAILEMAKNKELLIEQQGNFRDIFCKRIK